MEERINNSKVFQVKHRCRTAGMSPLNLTYCFQYTRDTNKTIQGNSGGGSQRFWRANWSSNLGFWRKTNQTPLPCKQSFYVRSQVERIKSLPCLAPRRLLAAAAPNWLLTVYPSFCMVLGWTMRQCELQLTADLVLISVILTLVEVARWWTLKDFIVVFASLLWIELPNTTLWMIQSIKHSPLLAFQPRRNQLASLALMEKGLTFSP